MFCSYTSKNIMSSTTTVCQGLQSCLEPLFIEPSNIMHQNTPTKQDLTLKWPETQSLSPHQEQKQNKNITKPNIVISPPDDSNKTGELGGWNFIESHTKTSQNRKQVYVHPLAKQPFTSLSPKSLEMCTEGLGCETGISTNLNMEEFTSLLLENQQNSMTGQRAKPRSSTKKSSQASSFPPPLTSISGSDGVQVRTHREGGRLVIKAVSYSSCNSYFQAERENGRLRLSLFKDECMNCNTWKLPTDNEESYEEEEEECYEDEVDNDCFEYENEVDEVYYGDRVEHTKENGGRFGHKIGNGEWPSTSRCNGDGSGSKRLPSLPFCVAIS